jgi:hypothetical protein
VEFLGASNLEIINRGNERTFCHGYRSEVIDITLGSSGLLESIMSWEVSMEPSLSNQTFCSLFGARAGVSGKNPMGTNWGSFWEELKDLLSRGPMMCTGDEAGLELALNWVQHAMITPYEDNCPLQLVKLARSSPEVDSEIGVPQKRCKSRRDQTPRSWELYREAQQVYRRQV